MQIGTLYRITYRDNRGQLREAQVAASVVFGVTIRKDEIIMYAPGSREDGEHDALEGYLDDAAQPPLGEDDLIFEEDQP